MHVQSTYGRYHISDSEFESGAQEAEVLEISPKCQPASNQDPKFSIFAMILAQLRSVYVSGVSGVMSLSG